MTDNTNNNNNDGLEDDSVAQNSPPSENIAPNQEIENLLQKLQTHLQAIDGQNASELNVMKSKETDLLKEMSDYSAVLDNQYSIFSKQSQTHVTLRQKYLKREMDFLLKYANITDELIPLVKGNYDNRKKPLTREQQTKMNLLLKKETNLVNSHHKQYRNQYLQYVAHLCTYWLTAETARRRELVAQFLEQLKAQNHLIPGKEMRDELLAIRNNMKSIRSEYNALRRDDQKNEMLYVRAMNQRELKRCDSMEASRRERWHDLCKRRDSGITKLGKEIGLPDNWSLNADKKKWLQSIFNQLDF